MMSSTRPDRLEDGLEHILDGAVDEDGGIEAHRDGGSLRKLLVEARQKRVHLARHVQRIGHRRLDDADGDGGLAVVAALAPHIRRAEFHPRHIAKPHLQAAAFLQHDVGEFLRGAKRRARQHGELALHAFDAAGGNVGILVADGAFDVLHGEALSREPCRIDPHAHGIAPLAVDRHIRHAVEILEAVDHEAVDIIGELGANSCSPTAARGT
jgi:hypothetical protein